MKVVSTKQFSIKLGASQISLYSFEGNSNLALTIQDASADDMPLFEHPEGEEVAIIQSPDNMTVVVPKIGLEDLEKLASSLEEVISSIKAAQSK